MREISIIGLGSQPPDEKALYYKPIFFQNQSDLYAEWQLFPTLPAKVGAGRKVACTVANATGRWRSYFYPLLFRSYYMGPPMRTECGLSGLLSLFQPLYEARENPENPDLNLLQP